MLYNLSVTVRMNMKKIKKTNVNFALLEPKRIRYIILNYRRRARKKIRQDVNKISILGPTEFN